MDVAASYLPQQRGHFPKWAAYVAPLNTIQNNTTPATARAFFIHTSRRDHLTPLTGLMQFQTDHKLSATAQFCSAWNLLMKEPFQKSP